VKILRTEQFDKWLKCLRDGRARARIGIRLERLAEGNPGQSRSVAGGIVELKIDFGPGYRVYYVQRGDIAIVLLCGGDKSTQAQDIRQAKTLLALLPEFED
jgi:putative addiction module killer protein